MRVSLSWRTWLSAGLLCLPCVFSTGCNTVKPGGSWFSWTKPKPSAALASAPAKPSVSSLPTPSATTAGNPAGSPAGMGQLANGSQPPQPSVGTSGNGYYTGPYGMAGQTAAGPTSTLPTSAPSGYAAQGYSAPANSPSAYGGYQSPYQAAQQPGQQAPSGYRTADARNLAGATGGYGAPAAPSTSDQWGRTEPRGVSQPAGYLDTTAGPTGGYQPVAGAPGGYAASADRYSGNTNPVQPATSVTPRPTGSYRPGSTGRTTTAIPSAAPGYGVAPAGGATSLPPASSAPAGNGYQTSNYPGTGYQTTSYPTSYPSTGAPANSYPGTSGYPASSYPAADATRTANSAGSTGGYAYPSAPATR